MRNVAWWTAVLTIVVSNTIAGQEAKVQQKSAIVVETDRVWYEAGESFPVLIRATDAGGRPLPGPIQFEVVERGTAAGKTTERIVRQEQIQPNAKDGMARVPLRLDKGGEYVLRAEARDGTNRTLRAAHVIEVSAPHVLDRRIDTLLREWAVKTSNIKSMYAEFTRTIDDRAWGKSTAEGSARFLHPNRARLDIEKGDNPESYVLTGDGEIWEYKVSEKKIKVYKLPPELAANSDVQDGPLPFLLGAKADKIKARYRLEIVADDDKHVQLRIYPKLQDDRQNFVRAELWLAKETFLPTKLAFLEPNHNLVTYQFKGIWTNIEIPATDFKGKRIDDWEIIVQQLAGHDDPSRPRR